jgi:hypothetical protein
VLVLEEEKSLGLEIKVHELVFEAMNLEKEVGVRLRKVWRAQRTL